MPIGFATIDWWIVGIYVVFAALPGFLCRKYIRGQADFLVAGRTLSIWLATATLTATEMGLVTVMYWAEFGYTSGFSAMVIGLIALSATLFVGLTGFMVRGLRASGATTVAEYYEQRYTTGVRLLGGFIIALAGILNYGVFLQIEATFVRIITGMPETITITASTPGAEPWHVPTVNLVMTVLLAIVLAYTLLGGMVSVALTDYIQFIILTLGIGGATYWVFRHSGIGGLEGMVEAVEEHRPGYGFNPFIRGVNEQGKAILGVGVLWILWQSMHWLGTNTWQTQAFRTAATDSPRTARAMWILTAFNYFGRGVIPMIWGVGALAFLSATSAPEALKSVHTVEAMPIFLAHLPAGLLGFLTAGMLAALMSTHSSYLLAWSGVLTEDLAGPIVKSLTGREISQSWRVRITRLFILLIGVFLLCWGLWFQVPATVWGYLAMTGTIYIAGALPLVAFGLYWKRANRTGAYVGLIGGAAPGIIYLFLRIATLIVEPAVKDAGHAPQHLIARWSADLTDALTGVISFPLALVGMIAGSLWAERRRQRATAMHPGTALPGGEG